MANKDFNRLKLLLVEKKQTGKWLAEQLGKIKLPFLNGVQIKVNQMWKA